MTRYASSKYLQVITQLHEVQAIPLSDRRYVSHSCWQRWVSLQSSKAHVDDLDLSTNHYTRFAGKASKQVAG